MLSRYIKHKKQLRAIVCSIKLAKTESIQCIREQEEVIKNQDIIYGSIANTLNIPHTNIQEVPFVVSVVLFSCLHSGHIKYTRTFEQINMAVNNCKGYHNPDNPSKLLCRDNEIKCGNSLFLLKVYLPH